MGKQIEYIRKVGCQSGIELRRSKTQLQQNRKRISFLKFHSVSMHTTETVRFMSASDLVCYLSEFL